MRALSRTFFEIPQAFAKNRDSINPWPVGHLLAHSSQLHNNKSPFSASNAVKHVQGSALITVFSHCQEMPSFVFLWLVRSHTTARNQLYDVEG